MKNAIIINLAIITAGFMVAEILKPAEAIGGSGYSMKAADEFFVWVIDNVSGEDRRCANFDLKGPVICSPWSN